VNVRVLEVAQQELDEAVSYYNGQVDGLGNAFLLEVVAAIERIRRFPEGWHRRFKVQVPLTLQLSGAGHRAFLPRAEVAVPA
jgi:hypothetical protein